MDVSVISNRVYQKVRDSMRGQFREQVDHKAYRHVRNEVYRQVYRHTGRDAYEPVHRQVVRAIW